MNNKIYQIGFFVLLAINLTMVALIVFRPGHPPQMKEMGANNLKDEIAKELAFTDDQKEVFERMAMEHRQDIHEISTNQGALINDFFSLLLSKGAQEDKQSLLNQMLEMEKQKLMITFGHFEDLKEICNEDQSEKFEDVMKRIVPRLTNSSQRPPVDHPEELRQGHMRPPMHKKPPRD